MQWNVCGGLRLQGTVQAVAYAALAIATLGGLSIGPAAHASIFPAYPAVTAAIRVEGQAHPTRAWATFCESAPSECGVELSEPETIMLTPEAWRAILAVNVEVNSTITPITDQDHWGEEDRWDYPEDGRGDCEDIQLLKRRLLSEGGLPRRTMRMTVVLDEEGAGHAVLMVRTDRGDLILDNKRDTVLPWKQTGYTFIKREGSDGATWVWLTEQGEPTATAAR